MIVLGEGAQGGIVDDVAVLGILATEHSAHAVVEDLGRHAAKHLESGSVAAQQGLQILVQHEAAPLHPAVAEHQREQPEDPLSAGLIGEDGTEMREVHPRPRITSGAGFRGGRLWAWRPGGVSKRTSKPVL